MTETDERAESTPVSARRLPEVPQPASRDEPNCPHVIRQGRHAQFADGTAARGSVICPPGEGVAHNGAVDGSSPSTALRAAVLHAAPDNKRLDLARPGPGGP